MTKAEALLVLGQQAVRDMLPMRDCIDLMREVMVAVLEPDARQPLRSFLPLPGRLSGLGIMPGYLPASDLIGAKVITVFPNNFDVGMPSHQGGILIFETGQGRLLAIIHAGEITAIRTAAASAVATDVLANPDASILAILGYGEQAERHLESMALVRPLSDVRVWGRSPDRAQRFVEHNKAKLSCSLRVASTIQEAIAGAHIICTTTAASQPILHGAWLQPGMHLNLVGSSKASEREADDETVRRGCFFVDLTASTLAQAGEYLSALAAGVIGQDHILGQIGEVIQGRVPGRRDPDQITIYKSLGINAQDLGCARFLFDKAKSEGAGNWVNF